LRELRLRERWTPARLLTRAAFAVALVAVLGPARVVDGLLNELVVSGLSLAALAPGPGGGAACGRPSPG
jgi:hypothetical protein